jgi:SH3-like domain-containing protein
VNTQVDRAVLNNIAWCGMVCDTHEIAGISKENLWGLLSKAPIFHPEIITSSKNITNEELKYFIENGEVSSIKDSYANLDLLPFGFKILFEAEWIYHASVSDVDPIQTNWRVITTEKDLAQWTKTSELESVIKPNLLKLKDVKIFIREKNDGIYGFIANLSANVVGISNVFSVGNKNESLWRDIPKIVSIEFPGLSIVGYEHKSNLTAAHLSGWTSIGPLRVWIKSNK